MNPYDEESELATYLWDHFRQFFTAVEQEAYWAVYADRAASSGSGHVKEAIWNRHLSNNPAAVALLADGVETFRRRAARRVFDAHQAGIDLNRCPACRRIVRTPKARQCFWCGYDWHGT